MIVSDLVFSNPSTSTFILSSLSLLSILNISEASALPSVKLPFSHIRPPATIKEKQISEIKNTLKKRFINFLQTYIKDNDITNKAFVNIINLNFSLIYVKAFRYKLFQSPLLSNCFPNILHMCIIHRTTCLQTLEVYHLPLHGVLRI